ncbi:MAG TPA: hypothetical protein VGG42_06275, partial [Acidobacteriaceae bacterium]
MRTYAALWRPILALSLAFCALWLIVSTWAWPFVGDASYVHYCVFLIQRGLHPCRDIVDVTLPGAYLAEQAVMATFGPGALAWRLYDLVLMAATAAATLYLLAPQRRAKVAGKSKSQSEALLAGAFASVLLFAVHAQDGVNMLGERDLEVGIALLISLALLAFLRRHHATANALQQTLLATLAGFLSAAAFTIKPTAALTILVLLGWMLWLRQQHRFSTLPIAAFTLSGLLTVAALALYLWQQSALAAFFTECNTIVRYHASLDHRPLGYLLAHCFSPIMLLVSLWLLLRILAALLPTAAPGTEPTLLAQAKQNPDLLAIALCAATGFVSYLAQRKGFSYQRYPLLIFLLPLIARDLFHFLHARRAVRALAALAIATGLGMVLFFTHRATTFERTAPNQQLLA